MAFLRAVGRGTFTGENVTELLSAGVFVCLNRKFFPFLKGEGGGEESKNMSASLGREAANPNIAFRG